MTKKRMYCSDIEADDLLAGVTKIWCMSNNELDPHMNTLRKFTLISQVKINEMFQDPDNILVMHNGIAYDGPAITKVGGIEVKAEIIDTLFLSWYLYPKRTLHGLASHGEDLGIPKPEINDWENLSLKEYIHRCEEDTKIQTALWKDMWNHLMLLYGSSERCWHAIRHLNFKARCAALQEKARWKLDLPTCKEADAMFSGKMVVSKDALQTGMPKVPQYTTANYPAKAFKMNGDISANGQKWVDKVIAHRDPEEYDFDDDPKNILATITKEFKYISSYAEPNAGSHIQVKDWLYSMGWVPESFKYKRDKATNKVTPVPQIKNQETKMLCDSIVRLIADCPALEHLKELSIVTHRKTITNTWLMNVDEDGYVTASIQGLTNTLRFKHKICLNIPSTRTPYGALLRGLLLASDDDHELCGSDMASIEDRTKQHFMWKHDPDYVRDMMTEGFDPHLDMCMAAGLLSFEQTELYKAFDKGNHTTEQAKVHSAMSLLRHGGKGCNYAATYGATGPTIARAAGVDEAIGNQLFEAYWKRNWSIAAIANECEVKQSRGMKWLWNPVAKLWIFLKAEKDKFSTLNQSTATYCFDRWLHYVLLRRPQLTGQFHDELILNLKKGNRDAMIKILKNSIKDVNEELCLNRELDCDIDFGDSYAAIH